MKFLTFSGSSFILSFFRSLGMKCLSALRIRFVIILFAKCTSVGGGDVCQVVFYLFRVLCPVTFFVVSVCLSKSCLSVFCLGV